VIVDRRAARAAAKRTGFGHEVQSALWTGHEFETLRMLHHAELLARDVDHVCSFFRRFGVQSDPGALAADLWDRFTRGVL
jgi:hypothetical protein